MQSAVIASALALSLGTAFALPAHAQQRRGGAVSTTPPEEAPAGFDNLTNGYLDQGPPSEELDEDNVVALRSFNDNRFIFEEVEVASAPPSTPRAVASVTRTWRPAAPAR